MKKLKYDLNEKVENFIKLSAEKYNLSKVILFGSRARGDNSPRSDIDLAVKGGNVRDFRFAMEEESPTLLFFDVIDLSETLNKKFLAEIERDGVTLYEKI